MTLLTMLTQKQVDRACRLLKVGLARAEEVTKLDRRIARAIGCSAATILRLRRGKRHLKGMLVCKFPKHSTTNCPRCGPVPGTYCVVCAAREGVQRMAMTPLRPTANSDEQVRLRFMRRDDPTPEEIAERAAEIRRRREEAMRAVRRDDNEDSYSQLVG